MGLVKFMKPSMALILCLCDKATDLWSIWLAVNALFMLSRVAHGTRRNQRTLIDKCASPLLQIFAWGITGKLCR